ncbi:MAG: GxxExxY protein [Caldilineaceae bacterium]|nr:GxxExxY protein [Caldilineaceae bacterium]
MSPAAKQDVDDQRWERILGDVQQLSPIRKLALLQRLADSLGRDWAAEKREDSTSLVRDLQYVKLETDELTYQIIGCAMELHRTKGPGFREDTYQRDLESAFQTRRLLFASQKVLEVFDSGSGGKLIGYYIPDFIVDNRVIVEIKALNSIDNSHLAQVIGYLAVSGCQVGLLINFGERSLEFKRVLPPNDVKEHKVNRQWLFVPEWLREE